MSVTVRPELHVPLTDPKTGTVVTPFYVEQNGRIHFRLHLSPVVTVSLHERYLCHSPTCRCVDACKEGHIAIAQRAVEAAS